MKLLGIESRDIYVAIEYSLAELRNMQRFFEKAVPLFRHVHGEEEKELTQEIIENEEQLLTIIKHTEENMENGS